MRRKIYDRLLEWKATGGESALMIDDARRVGKSWIAEEFAKREYRSYILIDFNKVEKQVKDWFDQYLNELDTLFAFLSNYFKVKLYPRESLIILDEVNECPRARSAIKYLVADGRYDYLETGSLISINCRMEGILLPSEEDRVPMYPMDFEEFLWVMSYDTMMNLVRTQMERRLPMGQAMHRKLMTLFRMYLILGGMPQVVEKWTETKDFGEADRVKHRILSLYRGDIAKHAGGLRQRVEGIFDAIPGQLSKHEKKFRLSAIGKNARLREYESAFAWLDDAMMVNLCFSSTEPNIGLRLNEERTTFKCYMGDTGLLIAMAFSDGKTTDASVYQKLLTDKLEVNKGMLVENVVAQMLRAAGHSLFFYSNPSVDDVDKRMEIDFLIQKQVVTSRHNISPIEVKSKSRYTLTSLTRFRHTYDKMLSTSFVLHSGNVEQKDGVVFLPLYMAGLV